MPGWEQEVEGRAKVEGLRRDVVEEEWKKGMAGDEEKGVEKMKRQVAGWERKVEELARYVVEDGSKVHREL